MKRRKFVKNFGAAATALSLTGCSSLSMSSRKMALPQGTMPYTTLGKTGIKVSRFGFGSHLKKELIAKPKTRDRMIKLGFDGGMNLFDVYDHGGYGQFKPMGKSLRNFRQNAVVSLCAVKKTDELQAEINSALNDFYSDYIDLYRLYAVDDDRIAMMEKNKQAGKIRAVGVVTHDEATMMKYLDDYGNVLDYVMIVFNFHHHNGSIKNDGYPDNDYSALIPRCERMGMGILGIKPMGSDHMIALAKEKGFFKNNEINLAQAMLRFVFKSPEIDCTMTSINTFEELQKDLEAAYYPSLSNEEEALLKKVSDTAAATKSAYLPNHYKWLENWTSNRIA